MREITILEFCRIYKFLYSNRLHRCNFIPHWFTMGLAYSRKIFKANLENIDIYCFALMLHYLFLILSIHETSFQISDYILILNISYFLVFIRNRLISVGLEPVFIHMKKLCLASYYIQFSTYIKMYNQIIKTSFLDRAFGISRLKKTGFNLIIVQSISAESCL